MRTTSGKLLRSGCHAAFLSVALCFELAVCGWAQPIITRQPTNQFVSVGATAQFRVTATSASPPLAYQWFQGQLALEAGTNATLILTQVAINLAGTYLVVVSDTTGSVTSRSAVLDVDPAFTKITTEALAADLGKWYGSAWGDYDNDGFPDLFIHQAAPAVSDRIYRNQGNGTFTRLTSPIPQGLMPSVGAWGVVWGDYDQDGHLDLFVANAQGRNVLLHNRGDATFQQVPSGPGAEGSLSGAAAWGDYDQDGWLDLFVANGGIAFESRVNWFYRNRGDGTFVKLGANQVGSWLNAVDNWLFVTWVDYDDDGRPDLFVPKQTTPSARLYRNLGTGGFVQIVDNAIVTEAVGGSWYGFAWGDYDNDGRLDLFAGLDGTRPNLLYHNEGAGAFRKMGASEVGTLVSDKGFAGGVAWGDYDNDGFLDLFVANGWWSASGASRGMNLMYHNDRDGTFTRILSGSPANEVGEFMTTQWVDCDRDGFLDLFVSQHGSLSYAANHLYRNNGNSNSWLCVSCQGTASPRFGTGAKVRVRAAIGGAPVWQLRLIDAGGATVGGQSFMAHFGLGDAPQADVLRIEWPSGIVQELRNVAAKQFLTVTEPPRIEMTQAGILDVQCWKGQRLAIESSTDLRQWQPLMMLTNLTGTLRFSDSDTAQYAARFYRAVSR